MPRSLFLCALSCCLFGQLAMGQEKSSPRPNIIIMMADDLGFSDLGCYGGEIETPNLDALAAGGIRFTQFYNTARCCPTRAALLTGLYQHQAGIGHMVGDYGVPAYQGYLSEQSVTIAEALRPAGYNTLTVGKWHVGSQKGKWPLDRGFDKFFGTPSGGGFYFKESLDFRKLFVTLGNDEVPFPDDAYTTDLFTDYALEFVDASLKEEKPFFLYFAHIAPHWPLQAKPEDIDKYREKYTSGWDAMRKARFAKQREIGLADEAWKLSRRDPMSKPWDEMSEEQQEDLALRMAVYAAQVDSIDQNVGRLVEKLKAKGALENTVIMFLSDNGCSAEGGLTGFRRGNQEAEIGTPTTYASAGLGWANACDTPLRKFKMSTHEGGISTPLVVHWPAGISRRGEWEKQVGHVIDLMPTCLELAEAKYPETRAEQPTIPLAGKSLVSAFEGGTFSRDPIFWEHEGNRAVRAGDFKLVGPRGRPWQLYNLSLDRSETNNLAADHPEKVARLTAAWEAWASQVGVLPWPARQSAQQAAQRSNQPQP